MEQPEAKSGPGMAQPSRAQAEGAGSGAATAGAKTCVTIYCRSAAAIGAGETMASMATNASAIRPDLMTREWWFVVRAFANAVTVATIASTMQAKDVSWRTTSCSTTA